MKNLTIKSLLASLLLLLSVKTPTYGQNTFPPRNNGDWTFYSSENGRTPTASQKNTSCSSLRMVFYKDEFANLLNRGSYWTVQPANASYYTVKNGVLTLRTAVTGRTIELAEPGSDFIVDKYRIVKATSSMVELKKLNRNGTPLPTKKFILKCNKTIRL